MQPSCCYVLPLHPSACGLLQLDPSIGAVVFGWDPHFSYTKLCYASACLRELGCHFVATNLDSADAMGALAAGGQGGGPRCPAHVWRALRWQGSDEPPLCRFPLWRPACLPACQPSL